jgi:O-6-methylguanine DNA methyltransferase
VTTYRSRWGPLRASWSGSGLIQLVWGDDGQSPETTIERQLADELAIYDAGQPVTFSITIDPVIFAQGYRGEIFRVVSAIPFGQVRSYQQVASQTGHPRAHRAAGTALAATPLAVIIPAHRVIRADGSLGAFGAGGWQRKQQLLAHEGICADP